MLQRTTIKANDINSGNYVRQQYEISSHNDPPVAASLSTKTGFSPPNEPQFSSVFQLTEKVEIFMTVLTFRSQHLNVLV